MPAQNGMTRRALLASGLAAGAVPLFGRAAMAQAACPGLHLTALKAKPEIAVSLNALSKALQAGQPTQLKGMTRLDGYVVDEDNKDVVLFGAAEKHQPELQSADFIVSLRSAFTRGDEYRKSAAISIDSDPEYYRRVDHLKTTTPDGRRRYQELCALSDLRKVRVDGMPRHCRVAKVLVDADIKMKQVAQGRAKIPMKSPFSGDFDAAIKDWRAEIATNGKPGERSEGSITRYWFMPGKFSHGEAKESKNMVRFAYTQVTLQDSNETEKGGEHVATGMVNPYARAFTCNWTARMEETYQAEPLWRDMHNMYRFFALSRIIYDLDAFDQAGFDSEFLLDRYDLPKVAVPDNAPGGSRIELATSRLDGTTWTYVRSTCGGVDIGFNKSIEKDIDNSGEIFLAGRNVLGSRPAATTLAWNMSPGALKDFGEKPARPVSAPVARDPSPAAPSRSLDGLFGSPPTGGTPKPAIPEPSKSRSLQDLFKS